MNAAGPDPQALIADLRKRWTQMKDVDRAVAVRKIHMANVSLRALAKELNCSPTLMRRLNQAAQAPKLDRLMARQRRLSTRELARRAKAEAELQATKARESLEREREHRPEQVCNAICDLLEHENYSPVFGEQLVDEARRYLAFAEANELFPEESFPPLSVPLDEVLKRLWPASDSDAATDFNLRAECLVRFVVAALPDSMSRSRALGLVLDKQSKR